MRRAFTLIELLVVVAIIALLIAILLPALKEAKDRARLDICMNNMRQLAIGFQAYAAENRGMLPGSTWDFVTDNPNNPTYDNSRPLCWLGSLDGDGDREHMPSAGTIYELVGKDDDVYKCPVDKFDRWTTVGSNMYEKPLYSYTAPLLLTGAPISLLQRTRWPYDFDVFYWNRDWEEALECSLPWMIVEEDEDQYLADVTDSAWSNVDLLTTRHRGQASVAHVDGSVSVRAYQYGSRQVSSYRKHDAWKTYYELTDGRLVTAGRWYPHPTFGYIRTAVSLR